MKKLFYLFLVLIYIVSCGSEDDDCELNPSLTTNEISDITDTSAKFTGKIIAPTCDAAVTSQGFVYSKTTLPTTDDYVIKVNGENIASVVNNLEQNSVYFVRSFFVNLF